MMATVYLDRDNTFTISLFQDGLPPVANAVTKAEVWIPGESNSSGQSVIINSDGAELTLTDSATKIIADLSALNILPGRYLCYLTIYDAVNTNGIAWDTFNIYVREWPLSA